METEDDTLVMYLVVRRRTTRPFVELASAAALATRRCAYRFRDEDSWRDGFEDWWRHSFRKVCLRAEPREWDDLRDLDHERVGDVACLPPVRRSLRDRVLVRMQTLSDEPGALPALDRADLGDLTFVVATDLGMSSGKTIAQIGHAALMARLDPGFDRGLDLRVVGQGAEGWAALAASAEAVVRDGGLTEIAPGSETVLVLAPRTEPIS
ncbi:aminoacyl-tRNA hydrolase [Gaiella sp.]|uniref:aminoacyl-tRNA hydrolase n=1 Tax=Gaiella sp. TaxID=2663207 RepID=UPI0032646131